MGLIDWMNKYDAWKWDVFFIIIFSMFIGHYVPRLVTSVVTGNMWGSIVCAFILVLDIVVLYIDCRDLSRQIMIMRM